MVAKKNRKVNKVNNKEYIYISLQEASKFCNYSQEYLSLRARQGKLKAVKIERDWMTTRKWLERYIQSHKDFKKIVKEKKIKSGRPLIVVQYKAPQPPDDLPVEKKPARRYNLLLILLLFIFLATGVFGREGLVNIFKNIPALVQEFSQGFDKGLVSLSSPKGYSFLAADLQGMFKDYGQSIGENLRSDYLSANDFLGKQISKTKKSFSDFFSRFSKKETIIATPQPQTEEEIKNLKTEIENLKEGTKIKEVPQIQKIKEFTREKLITTIDEESVKKIQSLESKLDVYDKQISGLQLDMSRRTSGFISAPTIIQPVSEQSRSPKLSVQNGEITLETIGSGNIVLSAASNITVSTQSLIISANLIISGAHLFSTNSSSPALTVTQNGTGNIVEFKDDGNSVFTIADNGYATLAVYASTTPAFLIRSLDATTTFASSTFFAINTTSTFSGNLLDLKKDGTSLLVLNSDGNLGIGTASPGAKLDVNGSLRVEGGSNPVLKGNWDPNDTNVTSFAYSVYVSGKYAYVEGLLSNNLAIVDISNPSSPTTVGNWDPNDGNVMNSARSVYVSGKYAYVAGWTSDNLAIVDISNPSSPTTVGNWKPNDPNVIWRAHSVYVSGKYAYVAGYNSSNLAIVDISNPSSPTTVGNWDPNDGNVMAYPRSVYVSGKYAYVSGEGSDNIAIVDISNPSSPTTVGNWDPNDTNVMDEAYSVYVSGKYAYVAGLVSNNLAIVDISNPASPTIVGNWDPNDANVMSGARTVYISGKYAYVTGWFSHNLAIVDISNPSSPTIVGNWDPNDANVMSGAASVKVSGKYAYVAGANSSNLAIVDIGGIETPNLFAGSLNADTFMVNNNAIINNNLYVQNGLNVGPGGLYVDSGEVAFDANSSSTAFTFGQKGLGDILNVFDNTTEVFTILDGGNIGIGTTAPSTKLHVVGDVNLTGSDVDLELNSNDNAYIKIGRVNTLSEGFLWFSTGVTNNFAIGLDNDDTSNFYIGNVMLTSKYLTIASSGNVGIGTTSPAYTLDAYGTFRAVSTSTFSGNVGIGTTAPSEKLSIVGRGISSVGSGTSTIWSVLADKEFVGHDEYISGGMLKGVQDNLGRNWTDLGQQASQTYIFSLAYLGNGIVLAGTGLGGKILRSTDYGATWTDLGQQASQTQIFSLAYLGNGIVLAGTWPGAKILRSTDYGATWADLGQQVSQIYSLTYLGNGIVLAGTYPNGKILRSTDYGATWADLGQQASQTYIFSLAYLGNGIALAGTWPDGKILRSTDYGATWADLGQQASQTQILSLAYLGNGIVLAGTYPNGKILRSTDYINNPQGQYFWTYDKNGNIFYTSGNVGIGTTTPATTLTVYGTTTLMGGYVGIGTTTPGASLSVVGNVWGSGNITILGNFTAATTSFSTTSITGNLTVAGNIFPSTTTTYTLGSSEYKWANIYAATATIGSTITINSTDITSSAGLNLTTAAASLWRASEDLTIQTVGNLVVSGGSIDSYTKLMFHMNRDFTDSSLAPHTMTSYGEAATTTNIIKFGIASGHFDGLGDYLSTPDSADWQFTGDFTIDAWVYLIDSGAFGGYRPLISQNQMDVVSHSYEWNILMGSNVPSFYYQDATAGVFLGMDTAVPQNTWHHIAIVRNGNLFTWYLDGVTHGTTTSSVVFSDFGGKLMVGYSYWRWLPDQFKGYVDELRVSKGIARWTSNFTPPGTEYAKGNVGIGTTNPDSRLSIVGSDNTSGSSALNVTNASSTSLLFVRNDGNVGIGTTEPITTLQVESASKTFIQESGNLVIKASDYGIDKGGTLSFGGEYRSDLLSWAGFANIAGRKETSEDGSWAGYLAFATRAHGADLAETMRITSTGRVGIGTTTPETLLHIYSSGDTAAKIESRSTTSSQIARLILKTPSGGEDVRAGSIEGFSGGTWVGAINFLRTGGMYFEDSATERMRITNGGNVGIGTTTPNSILQVYGTFSAGTTTITGDMAIRGSITPDVSNTYRVGSAAKRWDYGYFNNLDVLNMSAASTSISGTVSETFTINSDAAGDEDSFLAFYRGGGLTSGVISWSSAADQFDINFPVHLSGTGQISGPGAGGLIIDNSGSLKVQTTNSGDLTIQSGNNLNASSSDNLVFTTAGIERMRIASTTGYVGIGTSTPTTTLTVYGTTTLMGGYVGIGTTTPGALLSVVGNIFGSGNITILGNLTAATTSFSTTSVTGNLTTAGNILPSANATYNLGSSVYKWSNIYAATATIGSTITINSTDITSSAGLNLTGASASVWKTTSGNLTVQSAGDLNASSTNDLILVTAGTERMRIDDATGYVGIGTTTPASTLQVYGTSTFMGGNVGIGTTNPGNQLQIYGDINSALVGSAHNINTGANAIAGFQGQSNVGSIQMYAFGSGYGAPYGGNSMLYTGVGQDLLIGVDGGYKMVIKNSTGNVGIGTTTPASTFQAYGTSTFMGGYVGIGTTTPGASLSVVGNIFGSGNITILGNLTAATTSFSTTSVTGNLTVGGNILPSANATYNLGSSVYKWSNIYAATATIGSTITINSTDITSSAGLNITGAAASILKTTSGNLTVQSAGDLNASSTNNIIFATAGRENMRIASTTGYVGIGTTTPASTLQVYGTSTFMGGYVGIGTTIPGAKLDVNGSLRVEGGSNPVLKGNWDPENPNVMSVPYSVYVSGKYAYVAGGNSDNLAIVDISNPINPTTVGNWDPNDPNVMNGTFSVYVSGKYAYVVGSDSTNNLAIVDISNPSSPTTVGNWKPSDINVMSSPCSVYVSGKYAYVVGRSSHNLAIVDISNPANPTTTGNWDPNDGNVMSSPYSVYVSGKYAYVAGANSRNLAIVDISNPSSPTTTGNWKPSDLNVMDYADSVYVSGKYAYVTGWDSNNLAIVDISNPANPTTTGNWDPNDGNVMNIPHSVYVSGKYAYVAGGNSNNLAIVDISNPASPTTVGNWDPNDLNVMNDAYSVYVSGKYAYVAGASSDNLAIIDIGGIETPNLYAGTINTDTFMVNDNAIINNNLYVQNGLNVGPGGLYVDSGEVAFDGNSSSTAFTFGQRGLGDILNVFDNTTEVFTILDGGNIGIATTSPSATLQVYGNIKTNLPGVGTGYALCHTTQAGTYTQEIVDCTSPPGADYAEMYSTEQGLEPGDLVAPSQAMVQTTIGNKIAKLVKTSSAYQSSMIGVVSDPSQATDFNVIGYNVKEEDNPLPIALNGRVLVKVSLENGPINIGDVLTSASIPGTAMKATKAGRIIGIALESFEGTIIQCHREEISSSTATTTEVCEPIPSQTGKIMVFVNPHWQGSDLSIEQNNQGQIVNIDFKQGLANLGLVVNEYGVLEVKKLKAQVVETEELKIVSQDIKKNGITVLDRITGQPFCIYIENSQIQNMAGECAGSVPVPTNEPSPTSTSSSPEISTSTPTIIETTPTEISTSTPESSEPVSEPPVNPEAPPVSEPQASLTE